MCYAMSIHHDQHAFLHELRPFGTALSSGEWKIFMPIAGKLTIHGVGVLLQVIQIKLFEQAGDW